MVKTVPLRVEPSAYELRKVNLDPMMEEQHLAGSLARERHIREREGESCFL